MSVETRIEKRGKAYYKVTKYYTSHTGVVNIKVREGQDLEEGDVLYTLTRLGLIKKRLCGVPGGTVKYLNTDIEKRFCEYFTHVIDIEYKLSAEEAQALEEEEHYTFVTAPQGAQYYVTPNPGMPPVVSVGDIIVKGNVIAIAMVMKKRREILYQGERGRLAKIYFMNGQQVGEGEKLFGIVLKPIKEE